MIGFNDALISLKYQEEDKFYIYVNLIKISSSRLVLRMYLSYHSNSKLSSFDIFKLKRNNFLLFEDSDNCEMMHDDRLPPASLSVIIVTMNTIAPIKNNPTNGLPTYRYPMGQNVIH